MTFLEMQTRVGELINQAVTGDTETVTLTEVKANLNIGYSECKNRIVTTDQNYYMRLTKTDLVEDQASYLIPTDLRRISRVEIGYTDGTDESTLAKAQRLDRNFPQDPKRTQSEGAPVYHQVGNMIELNPTPSAAVTDGFWLWYLEDPVDMSADADVPELPVGYRHLPILYAASKAKQKLGLRAESETLLVEFEGGLRKLEDELLSQEDDHDMVIITSI